MKVLLRLILTCALLQSLLAANSGPKRKSRDLGFLRNAQLFPSAIRRISRHLDVLKNRLWREKTHIDRGLAQGTARLEALNIEGVTHKKGGRTVM